MRFKIHAKVNIKSSKKKNKLFFKKKLNQIV
jgi:hypothetical protein